MPTTGSYIIYKINRLKRDIFWTDTLGTLKLGSHNKKRYQNVMKEKDEVFSFVIPF